jgi:hypothetical protein
MENLFIAATKYTPEIKMDAEKGEIKISGSSYPENANEFYRPINKWIENYFLSEQKGLIVNFYIYYFNTSTSKSFLNILEILETFTSRGFKIVVNWYYSEDDDDGLDSGERLFMELDINYHLIALDSI